MSTVPGLDALSMIESNEHPTPLQLQQLHRIQALSPGALVSLANRLHLLHAPKGTRLLQIGCDDDTTLYLLRGSLELLPADGHRRVVIGGSAEARRPLCRLRPNRYRVTALSPVSYLLIDNAVLDDYLPLEDSTSLLTENSYKVSETALHPQDSREDRLLDEVMDKLNQGTLVVPSLARVAEQVGHSVLTATHNPYRLAKALMIDPTLSLKVLKAANATRKGNAPAVKTCQQAIRWLGPEQVVSLVVNCALRETLKRPRPEIEAHFQAWWEKSLRVSAISNFLARMNNRFDPDLAALAGLIHRVGEAVLLHYANTLETPLDSQELDRALASKTREMGRILLTMWNLPGELLGVVSESGNLMRDHDHRADYADLVLVAERHAEIAIDDNRNDTPPDSMPAFHRLGLTQVSPQFSLQMVRFGNASLEQANALLSK